MQMSIYKAPNQIISPKRKVYRREGAGGTGALKDESIYTHTYTLTLSPPSPLSLSPSPHPHPHTHIHLSQYKEEKATGTGKDASLEPIWRLM